MNKLRFAKLAALVGAFATAAGMYISGDKQGALGVVFAAIASGSALSSKE